MVTPKIAAQDRILVAIMNRPLDFALARDEHWYRIPIASVEKWLKRRWPPQWVAFYQTKIFGTEEFAVNYFARVEHVLEKYRWELFPREPRDEKSEKRYAQLMLSSLQRLPRPIISRRWRRILFINTTGHKFVNATEINDLFDESPLEDKLWVELKRLSVDAERQELVTVKGRSYFLDFAVYCVSGKLNVETDGDKYHNNPLDVATDKRRDTMLGTVGWKIIRFTSQQITQEMETFCLPAIKEHVDQFDGLDTGGVLGKRIPVDPSQPSQLRLFDDQ